MRDSYQLIINFKATVFFITLKIKLFIVGHGRPDFDMDLGHITIKNLFAFKLTIQILTLRRTIGSNMKESLKMAIKMGLAQFIIQKDKNFQDV